MSLAGLLNQTAFTYRPTQVQSATTGAVSVTWTTVNSSIACTIQTKTAKSSVDSGAIRFETFAEAYFPAGTDIRLKDRISISSPVEPVSIGTDNSLWVVTSAPFDEAGRRAFVKVGVERVGGKAGGA